ncbi:DeoR/GlpR family DNA-binding transcription regulator [Paenibacillus thiaminolyticus]|uniref:DeoR/GlpR family DNA-binding transcription regulator n=1 Tax=Paenibacillus thiaminolyticus TaxID=49283 RepID=UPI0035A65E1D
MNLFQEERLLKIMDYLQRHRTMSVKDICAMFDVSRDTARRDIVRLIQDGTAIRTHGGVALPELQKELTSYQERRISHPDNKRSIGEAAAKLVHDHETIILDVSTTVQCVAEQMTAQHITAVTHSIDNAGVLSSREDVQIYVLGGYLNAKHRFLYGPSIVDKLKDIRADKAIIGASAIGKDGLYYPYEEDVRVKQEMARRSDQVIVVADFTKFSENSLFRLGFEYVDVLITDQAIPEEFQDVFERHEIAVIQSCEAEGGNSDESQDRL